MIILTIFQHIHQGPAGLGIDLAVVGLHMKPVGFVHGK